MRGREILLVGACLVALANGSAAGQGAPAAAAAKAQDAADKTAFQSARRLDDPAARLAALRSFVQQYPKSSRVTRAQGTILDVLLKSFPDRTGEIDTQAKLIVDAAEKGDPRTYKESDVAEKLALAGANGVDLKLAESFALDSVKESEPEYDASQRAVYKKYEMAAPAAESLHRQFAETRSDELAILALVYLQQGKVDQAQDAAARAYALDPKVDDVEMVRGRLALRSGNKAEALEDFEQSTLVGSLDEDDRKEMMTLYREAHGGSDAGMQTQMDAAYARLYPADLPKSQPPAFTSGHTVLLSLFTGSACGPCVGGDLAVEGVLASYPRTEVVALAFDQHIPEPDPLANPDSLAMADLLKVNSTPSFVLDGQKLQVYGGGRSDADKLYRSLTGLVDQEAASPTAAKMQLSAGEGNGGDVTARAQVTLGPEYALEAQVMRRVEAKPAPDPEELKAAAARAKKARASRAAKTAAPAKPATVPAEAAPVHEYLVNFALVEDDVRYSGENGVRFHRMVVRALARPAGEGFAVRPGETMTVNASFDPAAISGRWGEYLSSFEKGNDRFDRFNFISKDTALNPKHLAVAAWVEDKATHRVLDAGYVTVGVAE